MTLSALIRKRDTGKVATAIPAIFATDGRDSGTTVARIATVAVASPKDEETVPPAIASPGDTATVSRWWLIQYPDRDPLEVACSSKATHAEILKRHPDSVAAEPFTPTIRHPPVPMSADEASAIRAWLAMIKETDPTIIADVLRSCEQDADVRSYFVRRANIRGSYTNQSTA
jgi:hypothetical protein